MKNVSDTSTSSLQDIWDSEDIYKKYSVELLKRGDIEEIRTFRINLAKFLQRMDSMWMRKRRLSKANKERIQEVRKKLLEIDFDIINYIFTNERGGEFITSIKNLSLPSSTIERQEGAKFVVDDSRFTFSEDFLTELAALDPPK